MNKRRRFKAKRRRYWGKVLQRGATNSFWRAQKPQRAIDYDALVAAVRRFRASCARPA